MAGGAYTLRFRDSRSRVGITESLSKTEAATTTLFTTCDHTQLDPLSAHPEINVNGSSGFELLGKSFFQTEQENRLDGKDYEATIMQLKTQTKEPVCHALLDCALSKAPDLRKVLLALHPDGLEVANM